MIKWFSLSRRWAFPHQISIDILRSSYWSKCSGGVRSSLVCSVQVCSPDVYLLSKASTTEKLLTYCSSVRSMITFWRDASMRRESELPFSFDWMKILKTRRQIVRVPFQEDNENLSTMESSDHAKTSPSLLTCQIKVRSIRLGNTCSFPWPYPQGIESTWTTWISI